MGPADRVRELVAPILEAEGLELFDLILAGRILRVIVDRDGGVDLDAISQLTRRISRLLDEHDPVPGERYTLEVSSPGLERPLRTPAHYLRFVGTPVTVKTHPEVEGERRVDGLLEAADDEGIVIAGRRIAYDDIDRARTVFEWGPPPKPGGATPRQKKSKKRANAS